MGVPCAAAQAAADEFATVDAANRVTGEPVPAPLAGLREKQVRFSNICEKQEMLSAFAAGLEIKL